MDSQAKIGTNRDVAIDIMKGITIILMMLCHLVINDNTIAARVIGSFHMPLFFILAGYFVKPISGETILTLKTLIGNLSKNAKRLLLPCFCTMMLLSVWGGIQAYFKSDISYFLHWFLSAFWASADGLETQWGLLYVGPMWFLVTLFVIREIFYLLQHAFKTMEETKRDVFIVISCLVISVASTYIHTYTALYHSA